MCFPPPISYSRAEIYYFVRHVRSTTIIAELEEAAPFESTAHHPIAGFCVLDWRLEAGRKLGHFITIDVAPELRRMGIGQTLITAGEQRLAELGCVGITLEVAVDNHGAQAFYARMGYEGTARLRGYYADNTDAIVLRKTLPAAEKSAIEEPPTQKPKPEKSKSEKPAKPKPETPS